MGTAGTVARRIVDDLGGGSIPLSNLTLAIERFSENEFEVPDAPDVDGYLFQYGAVNWFSEPTFALGMVRQLETFDAAGKHASYVQVQFEYRYAMCRELEALESHSDWWFPGGKTPFTEWLNSISRAPVMTVLADKDVQHFDVWQEEV